LILIPTHTNKKTEKKIWYSDQITKQHKGTVQSGRTRVYGLYYTGTGTAGDIVLKDGGATGSAKVTLSKAAVVESKMVEFPRPVLFKTDVYATFTTEQVTSITVFHSGGNQD
jgi:hypothetical protein